MQNNKRSKLEDEAITFDFPWNQYLAKFYYPCKPNYFFYHVCYKKWHGYDEKPIRDLASLIKTDYFKEYVRRTYWGWEGYSDYFRLRTSRTGTYVADVYIHCMDINGTETKQQYLALNKQTPSQFCFQQVMDAYYRETPGLMHYGLLPKATTWYLESEVLDYDDTYVFWTQNKRIVKRIHNVIYVLVFARRRGIPSDIFRILIW